MHFLIVTKTIIDYVTVTIQCPYLNLRTEPMRRLNVDYKQHQLLYTVELVASIVEHVTGPLTGSM